MPSERPWTPGPLEYVEDFSVPDCVGLIVARDARPPMRVAALFQWCGPERAIANGNLYAAAPELYEALERLADRMWMICTHRLDIKPEEIRELSNARAALSKALPKEEGGKA